MRDFKTNLDADELIEIFDLAFNEYLVHYYHDHSEMDYDKPISDSVKCDLVAEALEHFIDLDVVEYVKNYVNKIDEDEIKKRMEQDERNERLTEMG